LENEVLDHAQILPNGRGADLLVVADNENGSAKVKRDQRHHVALAGFIDDHYVEARGPGIEVFNHPRKWHDPYGNGSATLSHLPGRFRAQKRDADSMTLPNTADRVEPADQRLPLSHRGSAGL